MNSLVDKNDFIGLQHCTWLYSGAEVPPHQGCEDAVRQYFSYRGLGPDGRTRNAEIELACKQNLARLLNGRACDIALMTSSSEAISTIAQALEFEEGDNIVINDLEFPSGVLPWLRMKKLGLQVRLVRHTNWRVSADDILAQVDERTKLVMTSQVSYLSGARLDYKRLYAGLKKTSALLLLDATQALGAIPVDMNDADFVVCSSYKWLLSTHGLGVLAINPARTAGLIPHAVGWKSVSDMFGPDRFDRFSFYEDARKFELAFPAYPTVYATHYSTGLLLELGVERIASHILSLSGNLIARLKEEGCEVMTPSEPELRAGNISIVAENGEELAEYLRERQIYVWGGDGRMRMSVHLFNDEDDIDRLLLGLKQFASIGMRTTAL